MGGCGPCYLLAVPPMSPIWAKSSMCYMRMWNPCCRPGATSHCQSSATQSLGGWDLLIFTGCSIYPEEVFCPRKLGEMAIVTWLPLVQLSCSTVCEGKGDCSLHLLSHSDPPCIAGDGDRGLGTTQLLLTTQYRQRMRALMFTRKLLKLPGIALAPQVAVGDGNCPLAAETVLL